MLKIASVTIGMVSTNVYYIYDSETRDAVIVDPAEQAERLIRIAEEQLSVRITAVLLTHGHFDHIMAAEEVAAHFSAPIYAAEKERALLSDADMNHSHIWGRKKTEIRDFIPLHDGDEIVLLDRRIRVIGTPGHTAGSICYYIPEPEALVSGQDASEGAQAAGQGAAAAPERTAAPMLISGDTLFFEGMGRTDLPTGSLREIVESIRKKLLVLPPETNVFPGHDETTTIGHEREHNPELIYAERTLR